MLLLDLKEFSHGLTESDLYVACSRAKQRLTMVTVEEKMHIRARGQAWRKNQTKPLRQKGVVGEGPGSGTASKRFRSIR